MIGRVAAIWPAGRLAVRCQEQLSRTTVSGITREEEASVGHDHRADLGAVRIDLCPVTRPVGPAVRATLYTVQAGIGRKNAPFAVGRWLKFILGRCGVEDWPGILDNPAA